MSIKNVLFDLDGTLLPMDQDEFVNGYFSLLAKKLEGHGYNAKELIPAVWAGTKAMVMNNGKINNEEAFWTRFAELYGDKVYADRELFEEFYANEFQAAKHFCGFNEDADQAVQELKDLGLRVVLATNPLFPSIATESRIQWAGLEKDDFELYTTYENCSYCKPNPEYYLDILRRLDLKAEECLMVGNDAEEDMIAESIGMQVFLLTDCLLNRKDIDISKYPQGGFKDMIVYVKERIKSA